jgi:hypothetical protein
MIKNLYKTIKWKDHFSNSEWQTKKEIKLWASRPVICITKGIITYEDKNVIVLSATTDGHGHYGENMCILKNNIL